MCAEILTLQVVAGNELQHLINEDDGEGEFQHHQPLLHAQVSELEDHLERREGGYPGLPLLTSVCQSVCVSECVCVRLTGMGST